MITIVSIPSAFNPNINKSVDKEYTGGFVYEYIQELIETPTLDGVGYAVAINGYDITNEDFKAYSVKDGDIIAVCAKPGATIAGLIAANLASMMMGVGTAMATSVATAAASGTLIANFGFGIAAAYTLAHTATMFVIGYGLSMLVSALGLAPDQPNYDTEDTYSWGPLQQTYTEGTGIPYIYGTVRVSGQVINQYKEVNDDSEETLNVQYALCDHLVTSIAENDIEINGSPTSYFNGISTESQLGTINEETLMGKFDEVHNIIDVGSELDQDEEDIRDTNGEVEKIVVTVTMPYGLYRTNSSGGLSNQTAEISIYYRENTGVDTDPWTHHSDESYTDNITESIIKTITIDNLDLAEYEIKLVRTNEKNTSYKARNRIDWTSIDGIVKQGLLYPGIAKYSISALATNQLSGSMTATVPVTLSTVPVYNPYTELWDDADATNFAWICYDLICTKAGKGPDRIIYDEFSEWAEFCQDNGYKGGVLIQTGNFWEQIQSVAMLGQAAVLHRGGKYGVFLDAPTNTVSHEFTPDNILEPAKIQYLPMEDRANFIELEYTDPDRDYTRQVISVKTAEYDQDTSVDAQKTTTQINAVITRDTAKKIGDNMLFSNVYLDKTITIEAHVNSFACVVGDLFRWKTPKEEHEFIAAGQINGIDGDTVTLSSSVTLPDNGNAYKIAVWAPDHTTPADLTITTRGTGTQLVLSDNLDGDYLNGAFSIVEVLYADQYDEEIYRLTHCTKSDDFTREITGLIYKPEIYSSTSGDLPAPVYDSTRQEAVNVVLDELLRYGQAGNYISHILVSWHRSRSTTGSNWNIFIKNNVTNTIRLAGRTTNMTFTISEGLSVGESYTIYVSPDDLGAVDTGGNTETITIQGVLAPPSDIENFQAIWDPLHRTVRFAWDDIDDIDLDYYEIREGNQWDLFTGDTENPTPTGTVVVRKPATIGTSTFIPQSIEDGTELTYLIKAVDKSGIESDEVVSAEIIINNDHELNTEKPIPTGLTLTTERVLDGAEEKIRLHATWDINAELDTEFSFYELELIQYIDGISVNHVESLELAENTYTWTVLPSQEYGVRVRAIFSSYMASDWSSESKIISAGDQTPPSDPTSLYLTQFASALRLKWNHSAESDLSYFKVYRGETSTFANATLIEGSGVVDEAGSSWAYYNDVPPVIGQTYYYWVVAVDSSGNESGQSNMVSGSYDMNEATQLIVDAIEALTITADQIDVGTLDAITAAMGILTAGMIQNTDAGIAPTSYWDVDNDIFNLGGQLVWDGTTLNIGGVPADQFGQASERLFYWKGNEDLNDNLSTNKFELTFENDQSITAQGVISLFALAVNEGAPIDKDKIHIEINGQEVEYL